MTKVVGDYRYVALEMKQKMHFVKLLNKKIQKGERHKMLSSHLTEEGETFKRSRKRDFLPKSVLNIKCLR